MHAVSRSIAVILQTGALPWRIGANHTPEVLLVTGRRSSKWIIPKGWPMIGKSLALAAQIEAFEEAGVEGTVDPKPLGILAHLKRTGFGSFRAEILVHALRVEKELSDWPEKGERARRWFPINEALAQVDSSDLRKVIGHLAERLQKKER
jgi:8-oxo-dGTP pyrophosphatase MutT (NUDIX family)